MYILDPNITSNELIVSLSELFKDVESLTREKFLPKEKIIEVVEIFKEDCQMVKDTLIRNYEKAKVDELIAVADELIEKIKQDPDDYEENLKQIQKQHEEYLNSLLEFSSLNKKTL